MDLRLFTQFFCRGFHQALLFIDVITLIYCHKAFFFTYSLAVLFILHIIQQLHCGSALTALGPRSAVVQFSTAVHPFFLGGGEEVLKWIAEGKSKELEGDRLRCLEKLLPDATVVEELKSFPGIIFQVF